jgi:hypothetical protein
MRLRLPLLLFLMTLGGLSACNLESATPDPVTETPPPSTPLPDRPTESTEIRPEPLDTLPSRRAPTLGLPVGTPLGERAPTVVPFPQTFRDEYEIQAREGNTIIVNYIALMDVGNTGTVYLLLRDPDGADIWRLAVEETVREGIEEIPAVTSGTYQLLATSENLDGTYSVSFGVR